MPIPPLPRLIWIDDSDRLLRQYVAYRHGAPAGTIYLCDWGPQKGNWYWAGGFPDDFRGRPTLPNCGYEPTPLAAALRVEQYWRDNGGK